MDGSLQYWDFSHFYFWRSLIDLLYCSVNPYAARANMIVEATIAILIYILAVLFFAYRNKKWKRTSDKFVKYYKIVVPTIVYILPLFFHIYNGTDLSILEFIPLFLGFTIWSLVPFLILVFLAGTKLSNLDLILTTVIMLSFEIAANFKVHVFPSSSTDGLIFIFLPICQSFIVLPVSLLVCYTFRVLLNQIKKNRCGQP